MSTLAPLLVRRLDEIWRRAKDPSATAVIVPFGPDDAPQNKTLRLSYKQFELMIREFSNILYSRYGISRGDTVSTYYHNCLPIVISFFSITSLGAIIAPLNPAYKSDSLQFYVDDTKPKLLIIPIQSSDLIENHAIPTALKNNVTIIRFDIDLNNGKLILMDYKKNLLPPIIKSLTIPIPRPDDVALILHTSGTTGRPKGVPLRHRNICRSISNIVAHYELTSNDSCQIVMPLFHVHGLIGCLLSTLTSGGCAVIPPHKFSARKFWKTMIFCNCSWYSAVPSIHQILLKNYKRDYLPVINSLSDEMKDYYINKRWRFVRSCSAALPAAVLEKLESTFENKPWLEAYAMTEASHQMCANPLPKYGVHKAGSVGKPTGIKVKILDDNNNELEQDEIGEISINGPSVTNGYLNRPDANKKCFVRVGDDIFFRTGDQGKIDKDGYIFLTGRLKEMINRGGEKIAPLEIDDVILTHPKVNVAVAFGVPHDILGETVNCAVVLNDNNCDINKIKQEIIDLCKKKLAKYKVPEKIFISDDVPRTATGKIQRRIVAAFFLKQNKSKL